MLDRPVRIKQHAPDGTDLFFLRLRQKRSGKVMAWFAIIAVPVVLFTFVGVNTLMPGLHSYG